VAAARKKKDAGPKQRRLKCPSCHETDVTVFHERSGAVDYIDGPGGGVWQAVEAYGWWAACKGCGEAWCSQDRAPSMAVLVDELRRSG